MLSLKNPLFVRQLSHQIIKRCLSSEVEIQNKRDKGRKMRGWQIHSYGDLDELQFSDSLRIPIIQSPSEVLIKIDSTSVNPIDVAMIRKHLF